MEEKLFKVIIFDFDGTLHNGEKWENWTEYMQQTIDYATAQLTEQERKDFMERQNITYNSNTADVANALVNEFGTAQGMIDFQSKNIYRLDYQNMKFVDPEFIKKLSEKYTLYIVSNSPVASIERHFRHWNIDATLFKKIYFNQFLAQDTTKGVFYKEILANEKVMPQEVLVIGDNFRDDLVPAQKLNMQTLETHNLSDLYSFFDNLEH